MAARPHDPAPRHRVPRRTGHRLRHGVDVFAAARDRTGNRDENQAGDRVAQVTAAGAAWLAGATAYPRSTLAQWTAHPGSPGVLPCGTAFDVVNVPVLFGRRMLEHLWADGPGSGPVATHRGRMLLFAAPGTAQRLPSLLDWEEWGSRPGPRAGQTPCRPGGRTAPRTGSRRCSVTAPATR